MLFKRLLGRERSTNQAVIDALYGQIVAAARQPVLYSDWRVPDTPLGRFEMLSLHVFLTLDRLQDESGPARDLAQDLTDGFFRDVENSLRELGIGDLGIPKRMKKLARMFYGRATSYSDALKRGDGAALAEALMRNVRPGESLPDAAAEALAGHASAIRSELRRQPVAALLAGRIDFPAAASGQAVTA